MSEPLSDEAQVHIRLGLGHAGDGVLDFRVSPSAAPEIKELLESEGIFAGELLELSAGPELVIYAASFGGGLGGMAAVLSTYFHRNQDKTIKFSHGDDSVELTGFSEDEAKGLITETLDALHKKQLENDKEWRRVLGRHDETEK